MFDTIGISDHFPAPGCPIRRIEVADGLDPGGLAFDPGDDDEPLGWMNENRHLRAALLARAESGQECLADVEGQGGSCRAGRYRRNGAS